MLTLKTIENENNINHGKVQIINEKECPIELFKNLLEIGTINKYIYTQEKIMLTSGVKT